MAEYEFRVTVEDLRTGDQQVMEFAAGDYVLLAFAPCRLESTDAQLLTGRHVLTVVGHRPAAKARTVPDVEVTDRG